MGNIDSHLENSGFLSDQSVSGKDGTNVENLVGICAGIGVGVLAAAFFTSGVCSVILAFRGRVKTMPFFPFLTLGYILMLAEQGGAA